MRRYFLEYERVFPNIYKFISVRYSDLNNLKRNSFRVLFNSKKVKYDGYFDTLEEAIKGHDLVCLKHNLPTIKNYKIINDNT